jgi:diguanylate cyclase (GGDEF)-like protein
MRSLSRRAVLGLEYLCAFFVLITVSVGVVGVLGVRSTAHVSSSIVRDELATAAATANVGRAIDNTHSVADRLAVTTKPSRIAALQGALYDVAVPKVDADLELLKQLHSDDGPAEHADLDLFDRQWATARSLLRPQSSGITGAARIGQLDAAYGPLGRHLDALIGRETTDATAGEAQSSDTETSTVQFVFGAVLAALVAAVLIGRAGAIRIRRAVEPENEQQQFVETLQVADDEDEAHHLLKRHLERAIPGANATILNRNNSADRLEAMTEVASASCLTETLRHASPRSCLAIRSARPNRHGDDDEPLLRCGVCGDCPGRTSCTPLTVSGEVIGAVLVSSEAGRTESEEERIRDSVVQAAPVLANLRNLAIAERRAATDSLTGLANKRSFTDSLKRMLAQSSRTLSPLSLLMVDLDHFKEINDQLGHPVGDQALANVGAAISSALRTSDFAGRNGGEEFAVLLPNTDLEGARITAEKIRAAIGAIDLLGTEMALTASLGIAVYPDHATTAENLERLADAALYTAKRLGRNRVEVAEPGQDAAIADATGAGRR